MSYFYIEGCDGRHYCYAKEPTFVCPMAEPVVYQAAMLEGEDGQHVMRDELLDQLTVAADALNMDPLSLGMVIRTAHQRKGTTRLRVDGRLTDLCAVCGHRMERKGFRVWIEHDPTQEDAQTRIADRLGFSRYRTVDGSTFYCETKKEAQQWARDEAQIERVSS